MSSPSDSMELDRVYMPAHHEWRAAGIGANRWFCRSIKNKILASVLFAFAIFYIPTFVYIYNQNRDELFNSVQIEALSAAQIIAIAIYRNYELETDQREIQSFVVGAQRSSGSIQELSILDTSLQVLSSTNEARLSRHSEGHEYRQALRNKVFYTLVNDNVTPISRIVYPISAGREGQHIVIGIVDLRLNFQRYMKQLDAVRVNLIVAGLLIALAITLVIMWLSDSITAPLEKLYQGMSRANDGDLNVQVPVLSQDEVGYATETFNRMLQSIQSSHRELKKNAREIGAMNVKLTGLSDRLKEAERLEVIGTLTSVIAHQLKNPLSVIRGAIASVRRRCDSAPSDLSQFVDILEHEADRTKSILERFLSFARKQELVKQPVVVSEFIDQLLHSFELGLDGVKLQKDSATGVSVWIDKDLLSEAVVNILQNAQEALKESGEPHGVIKVSAELEGSDLRIRVEDNAGGISQEAHERACEPFFTTKSKGTGLGLSMARKIVTLHGGALNISHSTAEDGTIVTILIPAGEGM